MAIVEDPLPQIGHIPVLHCQTFFAQALIDPFPDPLHYHGSLPRHGCHLGRQKRIDAYGVLKENSNKHVSQFSIIVPPSITT